MPRTGFIDHIGVGVPDLVAAKRYYDELMPMFSDTGKFEPPALATLKKSYVELKLLPSEPDMAELYTEAFLPKK